VVIGVILRMFIAGGGVIAMLQYGSRMGVWWGTFTRAEKVNRLGFGLLLSALVEGAIEGVLTHLPLGPRNVLVLVALILIIGGYEAMRQHRNRRDLP
jgi:hypothetical protein